ncbi:MAG: hypothetical protein LBV30_04325 [Propionibacteriaceae bacterium]|nr:hypothetical protein [Propionibacteriaceae bacterium]
MPDHSGDEQVVLCEAARKNWTGRPRPRPEQQHRQDDSYRTRHARKRQQA